MNPPITPARSTWPVGLRVTRKNSDECGTVAECDGKIKVKWDSGQRSYYHHGDQANVELEEEKQ